MKFLISLLSNAGILVGLVALVGLLLQRKSWHEVFTGTVKTIIGFMVFNIGSSAMSSALQNFGTLFKIGFGLKGVLPVPEAATAMAQSKYGTVVSLVMIIGFLMNIVIAKFTPLKNIFLTGQHSLYFACVLALILKAYGISDVTTVIIGGAILGLCASGLPYICQPYMRKITGNDNFAMGHYNMIGYALSGWIGSKVGNSDKKVSEDIKFPKWLSIFKDYLMGMTIIMLILFYASTLAAGKVQVDKLANNVHWLVFPILQAFQFSAGMYALITGVRLFIGEITAAFVSISEKYIPNSRPALDCPTVFPYAPTALVLGFLSSFAGGLICMMLMILFKSPIVIIPAAHICFFSGGTAGIFGNATGGWKGCVIGAFVAGILLTVLPTFLYPVFSGMGLINATFPNIDYNIVGSLLYRIIQAIQAVI
ncbi:PTS system ascorbate-specific IIC component [Thermohydrogenium kirishiense]|nr:PTS system ascorbate-specific IIC component [Thermohydrogenium kirishiense]